MLRSEANFSSLFYLKTVIVWYQLALSPLDVCMHRGRGPEHAEMV